MSDIVERAERLLAGITPGPWWWTNELRQRLIAGGSDDDLSDAREIAEFVAAAPDLVADLLAEVKQLEGEVFAWRMRNHKLADEVKRLTPHRIETLADVVSVDKIAAHRYREQDHSTIYGNAYCWCGWSTSIVNSHKTAIALWAEHVDAVLHPTIETVEELDALPPGSVVLDDDGMVYGYGATGEGDYAWYRGDDYDMPGLPALVIYTPEDGE